MTPVVPYGDNALNRFRWKHRYFIWTWSVCGVLICLIRLILNPKHPDWKIISWFTFWSYLLAIPVAIFFGAIGSFFLALYYRRRTRYRSERV